jgi:hypothetical protein
MALFEASHHLPHTSIQKEDHSRLQGTLEQILNTKEGL